MNEDTTSSTKEKWTVAQWSVRCKYLTLASQLCPYKYKMFQSHQLGAVSQLFGCQVIRESLLIDFCGLTTHFAHTHHPVETTEMTFDTVKEVSVKMIL